jgi:glycosyltransferase involved in cell wall biosynthesis
MAQLVGGLKAAGVDVTVVTRKEKGEYSELFDVPVYRTGFVDLGLRSFKITHAVTVLPTLGRVVKEGGFDVVHSHNPPAGFPASIAAKKNDVPHVMTMHGPWAHVRLNNASRFLCALLEAKTLREADFVTCDSRKLARDVIDWYGIDDSKVYAIQNAVETDRFSPELALRDEARRKLGIESGDRLVLYTGRFLAEKGITYLMEAIEEIAEKRKNISFLLVGGGFDEQMVSAWLAKAKTKDKVITIPYLEYEKMPYAYLAADVLVQPSLAEGLSRSVLEAMACGLPIVATNVGGNPELVSDGNGVLVEPRSSEGIGRALEEVLGDDGRRTSMGRESRRRAVSEFSVEKRIKSFIKLYERLC